MSIGDKVAFHMLRKSVDIGHGMNEYVSYATADEIHQDPETWGSWSDEGPRFLLWKEHVAGQRNPLYRYTRTEPGVGPLNAFFNPSQTVGGGTYIKQGPGPVGYVVLETSTGLDASPLQCYTDGSEHYVFGQDAAELALMAETFNLTEVPLGISTPRILTIRTWVNVASTGISFESRSNDPNPTRAADGTVIGYGGEGGVLRFTLEGGGEFATNAEVKFFIDSTDTPAPNPPVKLPCSTSRDLFYADEPAVDETLSFKVPIYVDGKQHWTDPKIIQRKTQLVD